MNAYEIEQLEKQVKADFRLPLRAAARDADFLLACFFAFFAGRAGFFRAMTNPPAFLTVCAK